MIVATAAKLDCPPFYYPETEDMDIYCPYDKDICLNSSASPSDDIWKKFEDLLPTPPRSPQYEYSSLPYSQTDLQTSTVPLEIVNLKELQDLDLGKSLVDLLDDYNTNSSLEFDSEDEMMNDTPDRLSQFDSDYEEEISAEAVQSTARELLHDCMWSGECSADKRRKDKPVELDGTIILDFEVTGSQVVSAVTSSSTTSSSSSSCSNSSEISVANEVEVTESVDPSSVFPYPLSDHSYHSSSSRHPSNVHQSYGLPTPSESDYSTVHILWTTRESDN